MGVIHKLRENIIEFILEQKKNNPSLSCRQLVRLINNQFQIQVSKSSINKVVQSAQLSSSVGRREVFPKPPRPKKFQIPPAKKEELLLSFAQMDAAKIKYQAPIYEGTGFILLKAAQWETAECPPLVKLIKKSAEDFLNNESGTVCDAFLFLKMAGCKTAGEIGQYERHALWLWNDLKDRSKLTKLWERIENLEYSISHLIEYRYEQEQAFYEVKGFKLYLEDGTELVLDAAMTSFWTKTVPCNLSRPIQKAVSFLSKYLISNNQSLILKTAPENLAGVAACFEDVNGKAIKKITVFNHEDQETTSFSQIPKRKRIFMAGVWPWQNAFKELIHSEAGNKADFVYKGPGPIDGLRVVVTAPEKAADPGPVILTNQKDIPVEEIVERYMLRWPGCGQYQEKDFFPVKEAEARPFKKGTADFFSYIYRGEEGLNTPRAILNNYFEGLHAYCRRHFFPASWAELDLSTAVSRLYGLSGCLEEVKNCLMVRLRTDSSCSRAGELEEIAQKFNENYVIDTKGRRLMLEVVS